MRTGVYTWFVLLCGIVQSSRSQTTHGNILVSLGPGQQLKGLNTTAASGQRVYSFLGIPYALPPTGDRRLKPPEPEPDWTGVKETVTKSAICPQNNEGAEDCLYLNVFTPDVSGSLPVFVWFHGGSYTIGSAFKDGDGATMAPQGVVTVTINYRLGPLGFMSTGDAAMPGNYGMLDQVLSLKWVQKYIRSFGGDPSQVTIGGGSAGSHSVSLMITSLLAKGLFHRGIMESGSALALTALERPGTKVKLRDATLRSASRMGCTQSVSSEVLQCVQKVGIHHFMNASKDFTPYPRVETTFGFLPDEPLTLLKNGNYNKVDTLHGTNSGEWNQEINDDHDNGVTEQEFRTTIGSLLGIFINGDLITRIFSEAYTSNVTDPFVLRTKLVQAVSDIKYGGATIVETNKYLTTPNTHTKHFLYEFDYRISGTTTPAWRGVAHGGERRFVFYPDVRYSFAKPDDKALGQEVQTLWANFIKHGDPTPSGLTVKLESGTSVVRWSQFTMDNPQLLKIDTPSKMDTHRRLFLIPLFERILEIMKSTEKSPIVG
ncbi:unnamed protein product [Candidula unifasciata]|uniref:Carboxylic ester hydrolase n=1 Tax=Candidula unifasciata TaxID=100452 RepID=A0A8S3ZIF5_9EUPU|nr:unnamed protein product [Candidula unifasciata]